MRKFQMKKAVAVLSAAAMAASLAACGGSSNETTAAATTAAATTAAATTEAMKVEKTETTAAAAEVKGNAIYTPEEGAVLEFFCRKDEVVEVMTEIAEDFKAETGVTVTVTSVPDAATVLRTRISTNDVPDLMHLYPAEAAEHEMFDSGYLMDLTNEPFMNNVEQSIKDLADYNGHQMALPMTLSTYGIYYRTDIFEKEGITEPTTFDELLAVCETLKSKGYTPFALDMKGNPNQITERLLGVMDNNLHLDFEKVAAGEMDIHDVQGLNDFADAMLALQPYCTEDPVGLDANTSVSEVVNGTSVMLVSGSWKLSTFQKADANIQIGYMPFPSYSKETKVAVNIDSSFGASASTKYPQACLAFIEYMSRPEVASKYYAVDGNINMVKGVAYDKEQLMSVYDQVMAGNIFLTQINRWPSSSIRSDIGAATQGLFMDGDKEAFLDAALTSIETYYE